MKRTKKQIITKIPRNLCSAPFQHQDRLHSRRNKQNLNDKNNFSWKVISLVRRTTNNQAIIISYIKKEEKNKKKRRETYNSSRMEWNGMEYMYNFICGEHWIYREQWTVIKLTVNATRYSINASTYVDNITSTQQTSALNERPRLKLKLRQRKRQKQNQSK